MLDSNQKLDLLAARSSIPELEPLDVPQDWRVDNVKDPRERCETCHWNGYWDDITKLHGSRSYGTGVKIKAISLERSVASTGCFSCAVLLALSRKLSVVIGEASDVWFNYSSDLMASA